MSLAEEANVLVALKVQYQARGRFPILSLSFSLVFGLVFPLGSQGEPKVCELSAGRAVPGGHWAAV